jgi:hypothetical protein
MTKPFKCRCGSWPEIRCYGAFQKRIICFNCGQSAHGLTEKAAVTEWNEYNGPLTADPIDVEDTEETMKQLQEILD